MQLRLLFILFFLFCLVLPELRAQSFYNFKRDRKLMLGVGLGTTNYYGDLNNTGQLLKFNPNIAVNVEYPVTSRINIRLEVMHYQIEADDSKFEGDNPKGRHNRNLSFRANNFELNTVGVFSLYQDNIKYYQRSKFNPYAVIGIGVTTVNPKALYQGDWYKLRGLKTEGKDYAGASLVVPFGIGVKFKVTNEFNLGVEAVYRITLTDYLDDVSTNFIDQSNFAGDPIAAALADRRPEIGLPLRPAGAIRGNPDNNDGYFVFSIKGSYYLPTAEWIRKWGSKRPKRLR